MIEQSSVVKVEHAQFFPLTCWFYGLKILAGAGSAIIQHLAFV